MGQLPADERTIARLTGQDRTGQEERTSCAFQCPAGVATTGSSNNAPRRRQSTSAPSTFIVGVNIPPGGPAGRALPPRRTSVTTGRASSCLASRQLHQHRSAAQRSCCQPQQPTRPVRSLARSLRALYIDAFVRPSVRPDIADGNSQLKCTDQTRPPRRLTGRSTRHVLQSSHLFHSDGSQSDRDSRPPATCTVLTGAENGRERRTRL